MNTFPKSVSVVMRCKDEGWAVGDTIKQLFSQDFDGEIELVLPDFAEQPDIAAGDASDLAGKP